ncbi:MAG: hypothetical protein QN168_14335 [Armatimonadota bacterium]|nr:hypothetical protein [Armatimonadota bacterium]
MARPRYSAAKRAREIRKQEERARKLARKHGRAAARAARQVPPEQPSPPADSGEPSQA